MILGYPIPYPIGRPVGYPVGYGSDRPRNYTYRTTPTDLTLVSEFISRKTTREAAK